MKRKVKVGTQAWAAVVAIMVLAGGLNGIGTARAAVRSPGWEISSFGAPTNFDASQDAECLASLNESVPRCDSYTVTARNAGAQQDDGSEVVLTDVVPKGLTVQGLVFEWARLGEFNLGFFCAMSSEPAGTMVRCAIPKDFFGPGLAPDGTVKLTVYVTVDEPSVSGPVMNTASISGGGAERVSTSSSNDVGGTTPAFGVSALEAEISGLDGAADTQAGGHPYEFSMSIGLHDEFRVAPQPSGLRIDTSVEDVKDVAVDLPLGFLGSSEAAHTCTFAQLSAHISKGVGGCPSDTVVGHLATYPKGLASINGALYNMVPEHGVAAEFAFVDNLAAPHVIYASVVPTPRGYVLRGMSSDIPQIVLNRIEFTLYGNPTLRDLERDEEARGIIPPVLQQEEQGSVPIAMLTNPAWCSGEELVTSIHVDSWEHPGRVNADGAPDLSDPRWVGKAVSLPPVTGCNDLRFSPGVFSFQPETASANSPTGLAFDLQVPQNENPAVLATPPLKKAVVTLPAGMIVNPASADGLSACSPAEIGWLGGSPTNFTPDPPACPDASKIGSVEVVSPLLPGTLVGSIYLATQNDNPFGSLLAGYVVIDDPTTGVIAKIAGKISLDRTTGQITGTFDENPQVPFSELKLRFFGGRQGELATPESCGAFQTTNVMTPWSAPDSGPETALRDAFTISSGCVPGFAPQSTAGVTIPRAGSYTPFALSFSRGDGEQDFAGLTAVLPAGLVAKLAGVTLCTDAQLAAAAAKSGAAEQASSSCPASSQVGTVTAGSGVGPDPLFLSGKAFLTGPYKGAPYGLAVVVPAVAGPFDLGTVVIRQALHIDRSDAHVTVVSDPFPTVVDATGSDGATDGLVIRLRRVDVHIDRSNFTLNPTNCRTTAITGVFTSTSGQTAPVSSRFAIGGCRELSFAPRFAASTGARTSRLNGASLHIAVTSGAGQANIGKTRVTLPKQLPSRVTTLQKACLDRVFTRNPAECPTASLVGTAKAVTPLLDHPLVGPAYIVSHGGEAFPDLVVVLQGNGITLELDGKTNIKKGITTSTFNSLPDAPLSRFELTLPSGRYSIFGAFLPDRANGSMCGQKLNMPTLLTGQNGVVRSRMIKVSVTGCHKHKANKRAGKRAQARRRKG